MGDNKLLVLVSLNSVRAMVRANSENTLGQMSVELIVGIWRTRRASPPRPSRRDVRTSPFVGTDHETVHGKNLVDGAVQAGVSHFVYSSVASADKETGVPHFESKWEVEKHLSESGLNWTVSAPVFFFENISSPWLAADLENGQYRQAMPAEPCSRGGTVCAPWCATRTARRRSPLDR